MSFLQSLILGIVQGLTEFLPVSSSAHLVLVPFLLKWNIPESQVFPFDVLVQLGTLLAVIVYFWKDLWAILKAFFSGLAKRKPFEDANARMGWYLILATIPAGLAGLFLKNKVEAAFNSPRMTAWFLVGTAALLLLAEFFSRRSRKLDDLKWFDALWIGLFQAVSIFPGVSRSGSTITGGMTRHLDRPSAARFSFLMSIPVMIAAGLVSVLDLLDVPNLGAFLPKILLGFVAAAVVGYLSIHWLLSFLNKRSLVWFAAYCILLAAVVLLVSGVRASTPAIVEPTTAPMTASPDVPAQAPQAGSTASSDPNQVDVQYTAALDWLTPQMSACAELISDASLFTTQVSAGATLPPPDTILLRMAPLAEFNGMSAQVGEQTLVVAVNPANTLTSLTTDLARKLFSGRIATWQAAYKACSDCFSAILPDEIAKSAPTLHFYLAGDEFQAQFEQIVMGGMPLALSSGVVMPSSLAMRQALADAPAGIGLLPSSAIDGAVKPVALTEIDPDALVLPIIAYAVDYPRDADSIWLTCISESLFQ